MGHLASPAVLRPLVCACAISIMGLAGCTTTVLQDPAAEQPYPSEVRITVESWRGPSLVYSTIEAVAHRRGLHCKRKPRSDIYIDPAPAHWPDSFICGFKDADIIVVEKTEDPKTVSVQVPWGYGVCESRSGIHCECDSMEAAAAQASARGSNSHCKCEGHIYSEWQLETTAREVIADLRVALKGRVSKFQETNDNDRKGECPSFP